VSTSRESVERLLGQYFPHDTTAAGKFFSQYERRAVAFPSAVLEEAPIAWYDFPWDDSSWDDLLFDSPSPVASATSVVLPSRGIYDDVVEGWTCPLLSDYYQPDQRALPTNPPRPRDGEYEVVPTW
jgi:hypothetical protein